MTAKNLAIPRAGGKNRNRQIAGFAFAAGLQRQVANAFNLYLNYKYYHWQTAKPFFRDLHIIFDEFAVETYNTIDQLTDRIGTMGLKRVRLIDFPRMATVKPAEKEKNIRRMLEEASFNELVVIGEMREIINKSKRLDPASANILKDLLVTHEKHHWWLRYILEKREWIFE